MIRRLLLLALIVKAGKVIGRTAYAMGEFDGYAAGLGDLAERLTSDTTNHDPRKDS